MCIVMSKSRYYKERNVQSKKRQAIRRWFVSIRHGRHVLSQCPKQKHFPPVLVPFFNISGGWLPLFRALAKNMAPMTNADESPTNRLTLFPIYLSLFIVSTLWWCARVSNPRTPGGNWGWLQKSLKIKFAFCLHFWNHRLVICLKWFCVLYLFK